MENVKKIYAVDEKNYDIIIYNVKEFKDNYFYLEDGSKINKNSTTFVRNHVTYRIYTNEEFMKKMFESTKSLFLKKIEYYGEKIKKLDDVVKKYNL